MKKVSSKVLLSLMLLLFLGHYPGLYSEEPALQEENILSLTGILRSSYALGGDTAGVKEKGEAIYLIQGETSRALVTLKNILIEHKPAAWILNDNEEINIIVFRGVLPGLGKIEVNKVVSKSSSFEIYAKYIDISDINVASQPAAVIPIGKLPKGKYSVALYVEDQLHKQEKLTVRRTLFVKKKKKKKK